MLKDIELLMEIAEAKKSPKKTDVFIEKYTPFIRSEALGFGIVDDHYDINDRISIAMFAFYEALMNYDVKKGAFFSLAKIYIRNRLIDYFRRNENKEKDLSLDDKVHDDNEKTLLDLIEDERSSIEYIHEKECTRLEIEDFQKTLSEYDLTLSEIAENAPRQKRTMDTCLSALEYARSNPDILELLIQKKRLPISRLLKHGRLDRKTIERHRKYLVGIFLAFTNGFVIIRGHLCQLRMIENERI